MGKHANRLGRAIVSAMIVSLVGASTALGAWKQGSTTCSAAKLVYVYSKASVWVSHSWGGGGYHLYYNPYRQYREDNTRLSSTWWTVEYDFEVEAWGGYCGSL